MKTTCLPSRRHPARYRPARGFTLIDLLISLLVVGVLATIATPSFTAPLNQARRADALVAVMDLQQAQERWHAQHGRYASLAELGNAGRSPQGHYQLDVRDVSTQGYSVVALAQGRQSGDTECREMHVRVRHGQADFAPPDASGGNTSGQRNRRCWRT